MAKGFKYGGYIGQLLRVNLTNKEITKEPLREDWARDFVGGVGLSARILYDELPPKVNALGSDPSGLIDQVVCLVSFVLLFFFLCMIFSLQNTASPSLISKIFLISSGMVILPPAVTSAKNGMSSSAISVGTKKPPVMRGNASSLKRVVD